MESPRDKQAPARDEHAALVRQIADWVQRRYPDAITTRTIAAAVARHPAYLGEIFRSETGFSLRGYLTLIRMQSALELIERGEKIEAVALCVGFRSKKTFYRQFKRHFGVTPKQYRDRQREVKAHGEPG